MLKPFLLACLVLIAGSSPGGAASVFTSRPDDPAAVYVDAPGARAGDQSGLLQAALDRAGANPNGGIVFVPAGRYRITRTLVVWRAVRIIGYGGTRPVLVLPERTPGYQEGVGLMVLFTSTRPTAGGATTRAPFSPPGLVPRADHIPDANQGTFYSSMMNVDVEIGDGNPAAVAVRSHVAQHGVLSHMDFRVGSGLAAIMEVGNVGQDLRFFGGRYGILTTNTSPFWPYTLIDSLFDGQREAAIREHLAGLTVIRTTFRNVPVGISIDRDYSDQLWLKDARFENVANAAIVIANERNATTQIGVADAICSNVPVFARYRKSAVMREDGALGDLQPFAERGGESVAWDSQGNVYVANGQVFVYRASGEPIGRIDIPERPTGLLFGGRDGRTLYVLSHRSLYAARMSHPGATSRSAPRP